MNDPLKKNTPSFSIAYPALAAALFAIALTIFATISWEVVSTHSQTQVLRGSLSDKALQQQSLERAAHTADATKTERAALSSLVISPGEGAAFITSIETLGRTASVKATVLSVHAVPPSGDTPGEISLAVQFSGSFAASMRFIELLETLPVSTAVSAVSLQYDDVARVWGGTLQISALSYDTP